MIENKELTPLKAQISKLENQANEMEIKTADDYVLAIDIGTKLKEIGSQITNKKESITKPLNESLRNVRDLFRPLEEQYEKAGDIIKRKLIDYKRQRDAEVKAEEAKIAARAEKGTLKIETAERKMDEIVRVDNTTRGKVGEFQIRVNRKVRITNEALIPRDYLVPDMVLIRRLALDGTIIPGVEVYTEESGSIGKI